MATTSFTPMSPLAVKVWARKVFNDSVKPTLYGKLIGKTDNHIIQVKDELKKGEGDRVRFNIRTLPTGIGVQDDERLKGNEEKLNYAHFDLFLGEKRHAFQVELNLSEQRTMRDVRADMKSAIEEWTSEYLDTTCFEVLAGQGVGPAGASKYHPSGMLGGNALLAPSADRIVYGGTGVTAKNTLAAGDVMTLSVLDKLAERAKLASPTIRKATFDGKKMWVVILHPYQVSSIRANTSQGQWMDISRALTQAGKDNPFASEGLGIYRDMLLVESNRIPTFTDGGAGGNLPGARALFLGAQAAVVAHGAKTNGDGRMSIVEEKEDYEKYLGNGVTFIWGMAKTRFENQSDFASFAVDTAAAPMT